MTREEAQQAWEKMRSEIDKENWLFVGTINPQMVDIAIEAIKAQDRPIICPRCGRTFSEAEGRERDK